MKYTKLSFDTYLNYSEHETDHMNGYTRNRLYTNLGSHHMYINTDELKICKEKFKKAILKYYTNIITIVEAI